MTQTTPSVRYRNVLRHVDGSPRSATEIYRRWAELPEWKALTRRHRNERRWLGQALENLANDGVIERDVYRTEDRKWVGFSTVGAHDAPRDKCGGDVGGAGSR